MFNLGDQVTMHSHDMGGAYDYDNREIPLGSIGTVVSLLEDDEEEAEEFIAINWEEPVPVGYHREFYDPNTEEYITYPKVWIVSRNALQLVGVSTTQDYKMNRIINKIKAIDHKVKEKTLKLRKITPMPFPKAV